MKYNWRIGVVGFGSRPEEVFLNKVAEIYIRTITPEPFTRGIQSGSKNDIAIPYCPWCREPVTTRDVTEAKWWTVSATE
jgi:hypothetical protein